MIVISGIVEDQGPPWPVPRPPTRTAVNKFPGRSWIATKALDVGGGDRCGRSAFTLTDPVLPMNRKNKRREGKSLPGWVGHREDGEF